MNPWSDGTTTTVTKYGVGPRGVDLITKKVGSGSETFGFPLYDVHGNMVATLARSGSNSYTTGNSQSFDVWGSVRSGSSAVDQKYCANLGHRSDAENLLQYMRARYYDPSTGRFISEDPLGHGANWFVYGDNKPTCMADPSGQFSLWTGTWFTLGGLLGWSAWQAMSSASYLELTGAAQYEVKKWVKAGYWLSMASVAAYTLSLNSAASENGSELLSNLVGMMSTIASMIAGTGLYRSFSIAMKAGVERRIYTPAVEQMLAKLWAYNMLLVAGIVSIEMT